MVDFALSDQPIAPRDLSRQVCGGCGAIRELSLEKLYREAAVFLESDGTQQALTLEAANAIHPAPNRAG